MDNEFRRYENKKMCNEETAVRIPSVQYMHKNSKRRELKYQKRKRSNDRACMLVCTKNFNKAHHCYQCQITFAISGTRPWQRNMGLVMKCGPGTNKLKPTGSSTCLKWDDVKLRNMPWNKLQPELTWTYFKFDTDVPTLPSYFFICIVYLSLLTIT